MTTKEDISIYKLSYKFQERDERDFSISHNQKTNLLSIKTKNDIKEIDAGTIPAKLNLYRIINPIIILDQGSIGSCVANAFALNISYQTANKILLSRLMLYALARIRGNTPLSQDSGTTVRMTCSSIASYGIAPETVYPYVVSNYRILPGLNVFKASNLFSSFIYTFVKQDLNSIKACMNTYNIPIIFGFIVYSSFMTSTVAKTGIVPMPNLKTEKVVGGHCMNIIGYDDVKQVFICANSWGTVWGDKGYCYMPYAYLLNTSLAADFCILQFK